MFLFLHKLTKLNARLKNGCETRDQIILKLNTGKYFDCWELL